MSASFFTKSSYRINSNSSSRAIGSFKVVDSGMDCSDKELGHYISLVFRLSAESALARGPIRYKAGPLYFKEIAEYLCKSYSKGTNFKWYVTLIGLSLGADYFQ
jgi:hypothetical protein